MSPGMKYTHYAPEAPLAIVNGGVEDIQRLIDQYQKDGMKVGVLTTEERADVIGDAVRICGKETDLKRLPPVCMTFSAALMKNVSILFLRSLFLRKEWAGRL